MLRTLARALQSSRRSNVWRTYGQLRNSSSIAPVNGSNGTGVSISAVVYQGRSWMPRVLYYPWAYGAVYVYVSPCVYGRGADSTIWFIVGTYCIQCTGTDHSDVAGHWVACVWTWNRDCVWSTQAEVKLVLLRANVHCAEETFIHMYILSQIIYYSTDYLFIVAQIIFSTM